jgi:hypothetical protein
MPKQSRKYESTRPMLLPPAAAHRQALPLCTLRSVPRSRVGRSPLSWAAALIQIVSVVWQGLPRYQASMAERFLPSRGGDDRIDRRRLATQRRDSAGSMVSSTPKPTALFSAFPRS